MGWLYYPHGLNRKQAIAQRIEGWERNTGEMLVKSTCLRHCYRGGVFSGVLWSVWERTFTKDSKEVQPTERWIQCDLLRYRNRGEWGYKDMEESMHPYHYSCPLSYLNLVSIDRYGGNAEWRKLVIEHHRRRIEKRQEKRQSQSIIL